MSHDGAPIRVHVQNQPSENPVFHATDEVWRRAADRHPELARRLDVSIGWTREDLDAAIGKAEILVTWVSVVKETREIYATAAPRLRMIFCTSAGIDRVIPFDWLPPGVVLLNNSGVHARKAGEWGTMALLMLANRIPFFATRQRERRWDKVYSPSIRGQVLVSIGVGELATPTLRQARALGMRTIGVRHTASPHPDCDEVVATSALDDVLPRADMLLLACPLTPATSGLVTRARIARMKRGAGIVNMARGAVMDQDALCDALESGHLGGAVIDVAVPEPLPADSRLWTTPNLFVSPHVSVDDPATYTPDSLDLFFLNLDRFLRGEEMPNLVDTARGY